jgi:hypothetical protein
MGMPIEKPPAIERRRVAIGRRVADARRRIADGRVTAVAARVHVSSWTWRRWEAGLISIPAELLPEVAEVLGVSAADLLGTQPTRVAA